MTKSVGMHEASAHVPRLLTAVTAGEDVIIENRRVPVARLSAIRDDGPRVLGSGREAFTVPDDFDAPLPDDLLAALE